MIATMKTIIPTPVKPSKNLKNSKRGRKRQKFGSVEMRIEMNVNCSNGSEAFWQKEGKIMVPQ